MRKYECRLLPCSLEIDDVFGLADRDEIPWSEPFVDIEGDLKPLPRLETRLKAAWCGDALYFLAWMEEPHLWATLTEHDSIIFQDHDFEVFLDPDSDTEMYGELEVNALNTTWDLLLVKPYRDGGPAVHAWEITGLETAVRLDGTLNDPSDEDQGWWLAIKWPFAGIKEISRCPVPPAPGDTWKINFSRVEWDMEVVHNEYRKTPERPEHNWVWSPMGMIDMHQPERWGNFVFVTG